MRIVGAGWTMGVALLATAACGDKKPADRPDAAPAVTAVAAPTAAAPLATSTAPVIARAIALNGLAEAQVTEASRAGGVVTIAIRFQRAQGSTGSPFVYYKNEIKDDLYLVAAGKKYFVLTDAEGGPLATPDLSLQLDEKYPVAATFFAKFPAPPPEVKAVSLVMPKVAPLDAIPLTDR